MREMDTASVIWHLGFRREVSDCFLDRLCFCILVSHGRYRTDGIMCVWVTLGFPDHRLVLGRQTHAARIVTALSYVSSTHVWNLPVGRKPRDG